MPQNSVQQHCVTCVILVNYNGFFDTKACLESIKNAEQDQPIVVIVDNASHEASKLEKLHDIYPHLKIIYNSDNVGFGRANNIGINWAQDNLDFEYLLLLNNDTIVEKNAFSFLIDAFKVSEDIGMTTAKIMYDYDRSLVWYGGGDINYKRGWPKIADYNQPATSEGADNSRYVTFISGCVMMFSRYAINKLKGFDPRFFMYCEDLEISIRAAQSGFKLYYEARSIIIHKVQGGSSTNTGLSPKNPKLPFLFFHMKTNQWIAMTKYLAGKALLVFAINYWIRFLYILIRALKAGRWEMIGVGKKTIGQIIAHKSYKYKK